MIVQPTHSPLPTGLTAAEVQTLGTFAGTLAGVSVLVMLALFAIIAAVTMLLITRES